MARGPGSFAGGARPLEGGWWRAGVFRGVDLHWWRNPRLALPAAWLRVVHLWRRSQGGMGVGWLPEAGGLHAQPAWLLHAFDVLAAEDSRLAAKAEGGR